VGVDAQFFLLHFRHEISLYTTKSYVIALGSMTIHWMITGTPHHHNVPHECWLWSLIIFLIQRSLLSAVFIPHEVFTPQKYVHSSTRGSAEGGYPLCGVRSPRGGSGGKRAPSGGSGAKPPKQKLPYKSIL
jgi:hypothetical protein